MCLSVLIFLEPQRALKSSSIAEEMLQNHTLTTGMTQGYRQCMCVLEISSLTKDHILDNVLPSCVLIYRPV